MRSWAVHLRWIPSLRRPSARRRCHATRCNRTLNHIAMLDANIWMHVCSFPAWIVSLVGFLTKWSLDRSFRRWHRNRLSQKGMYQYVSHFQLLVLGKDQEYTGCDYVDVSMVDGALPVSAVVTHQLSSDVFFIGGVAWIMRSCAS